MGDPSFTVEQLSAKEHQQQHQQYHHRHRRGKRNVLFYTVLAFAVCWFQLSANVFVYFLRHNKNHYNLTPRVGRFPLQPRSLPSQDKFDRASSANLRSGSSSIYKLDSQREENRPISVSSLEAELLNLSKRLEKVQKTLQDEEESSASSSSGTKKVFVPFTIRDAQRTVPTQIPHGFEIFDFIDPYASNGDQNQTAATQARNEDKENQKSNDDDYSRDHDTPTTQARLYHNGKPISLEDGLVSDCPEYSKRCYRSKFLLVIRFLLLQKTLTHEEGREENIEYYYFYMEADNDLCVPLSEIRDLAFQYQRYFVSTGTGASGWIISHQFLEDFYFLWKHIEETNPKGFSEEQLFEPDSVAAHLLQQNMGWSVTRRYLTAHSILVGTTNDEASIAALFQRIDPVTEENVETNAKAGAEANKAKAKINLNKETPEEAAKKAPLMEPSRYLPRCLEPHRGVWKKQTNPEDVETENEFDVHHWGFFDYDLCPDSDIFPCAEGQLEDLAKKDPFLYKMRNKK